MNRLSKHMNKSRSFDHNILFRAAGILFAVTMMTVWLICGMYAKYIIRDTRGDSARVAAGVRELELLEHKATLKEGVYELDPDEEVTENKYEKVIPGVDILKDPFVRFDLEDVEVSYELFVKVEGSDPFPKDTVTFDIEDGWELYDQDKNIYKYTGELTKGENCIYIIKDNTIYVSEHYEGKSKGFSVRFSAWLQQID